MPIDGANPIVKAGGDLLEAIHEIIPWVESNFRQHKVFTILGI